MGPFFETQCIFKFIYRNLAQIIHYVRYIISVLNTISLSSPLLMFLLFVVFPSIYLLHSTVVVKKSSLKINTW